MSNYEHMFELAIDCIKSGEDFDDFKANTAVHDNIDSEFHFIDGNTDRMRAKLVLLDSIWSIANYVYSEYMRGCPFFKDGCSNAYTYSVVFHADGVYRVNVSNKRVTITKEAEDEN